MKRTQTGRWVTISTIDETVRAFVPQPLPPAPALDIGPELREKLDRALLALGRLDSVAILLPDTSLFLYMYVRKEAVLSSQIEGTQSSLSDLLLFESAEAPGVPMDDVREVSNYVAALEYGLKRLNDGFPLSCRLLREIHGVLLSKGRGSRQSPGEYRTSQNWIGGTRPGNAAFVPPPADEVGDAMGALEKFLHDMPERTPALIKAALAHVQFETIHPFLDGNGRLGRLLITLLFCHEKVLRQPMLYLSLFFKAHRQSYYELLQTVRTQGDWERWLEFFAEAVSSTADQAVQTVMHLNAIAAEDRQRLHGVGRIAGSALRLHTAFVEKPILSLPESCRRTGLFPATIGKAVRCLEANGVVREITGRQRNRLYCYTRFIEVLKKGTEPA
jgi:Fic family protein